MLIRRCAVLFLEPRESLHFDLGLLFRGETGLRAAVRWLALAAHLDDEVEVSDQEVAALGAIGETLWIQCEEAMARFGRQLIEGLLARGLLIGDDDSHAVLRTRDQTVRDTHWRPLSAVAHRFSRWQATTTGDDPRLSRFRDVAEMVAAYGLPPPEVETPQVAGKATALPPPVESPLDGLMRRRVTCRNFAPEQVLLQTELGAILGRVFGAFASKALAPGAIALKKGSPSGGGLHPVEAYILVRSVEGLEPGCYHYHPVEHALRCTRVMTPPEAARMAAVFVADQAWFADAPVMVVMAARFQRNFWKYRNHPKAYRAVVLDAGHLSQSLYLSATELGLGAFVTAAINEVDIEQALDLDGLSQSPIAVCGFGHRDATCACPEFDPLRAAWPANPHGSA